MLEMHKKHRIPAIVLHLCHNGLAITRALGRQGIPVIGITSGRSPGSHSRYLTDVWSYEGGNDELMKLLIHHRHDFNCRPVLFPITDSSVRTIAARIDGLQGYYRIGIPDPEIVVSSMSKIGFAEWAQKLGLPVPKTFVANNADEIESIANKLSFPCVIKPEFQSLSTTQVGALKAHRVENREDLISAYARYCPTVSRVIVQEWIPGGDEDIFFCLQYYDQKSRPLVSFCGRKIRSYPPVCGSTASCEPVENEDIRAISTSFFTQLGFRGLCSMEFKRNKNNGSFVMVEPTVGRTDSQSAVADVNGINIPYVAYCDLTGGEAPRLKQRLYKVRWIRWEADRASASHHMRRGELKLKQWLWSIRPPLGCSIWAIDDPLPFLRPLWNRAVRRVRRIFEAFSSRKHG
jgi:D-aspartate ligase